MEYTILLVEDEVAFHTLKMKEEYKDKTKGQLINELVGLRQRITELEASGNEKRCILDAMSDIVLFQDTNLSIRWGNEAAGRSLGAIEIARDITERKKTEATLSESEIRFSELFDNMSSGVAVYKAKEGGNDFVFKDFNQAAEKMDGIMKEDLLGKSVLEVFPGVMDFGLFDLFQRIWNTGKSEHHPISFYKDERIVGWRDNYVYNLPSGEIVAVYDDVTEQKKAEEALRESSAQIRSITASAHDAVIMVDDEENISFWNEAAERIFGYSEEEMIGTMLHGSIIPERFREDVLNGFKSFRETGQGAAVGKTHEGN